MTRDLNLPGYEEVMREVESARRNPSCRVRNLGRSVQGRDIPLVILSDPSVPDDDKEHALVVAGMHGIEESGRAAALELMSFLLSDHPQAAETLRRQVVAVAPCCNPDGAVLGTYRNADDIDIAHTFAAGEPAATPEGAALENFALEFAPELVVDIHGLAGGSMKDRVWFERPLPFTPDRFFLAEMGRAAARAAEDAGFPQCETSPPAPLDPSATRGLRLGGKLAFECKSLGFGLETIEHYYREPEWRADVLAKILRLLQFGNEDHFGLGRPGYPASLVSGCRVYGLMAHGATAAERRKNRLQLSAFLRRNWAVVERSADGLEGRCSVMVESRTVEGENPDRFSVILRFKKPARLISVRWNGAEFPRAEGHGFTTWSDEISLFLRADISEPFGGPARELVVEYESPFLNRTA